MMETKTAVVVIFILLGTAFTEEVPESGTSKRSSTYPRHVVKVLEGLYSTPWGDWGRPQFCGHGSYAAGYEMRVEKWQGRAGDDTALNGVELICRSMKHNVFAGAITSSVGHWGDWTGQVSCKKFNGQQFFLTAYSLRVESPQGAKHDDTAANSVKFKCRDFRGEYPSYEISGAGATWGEFHGWSQSCPANSAICGIQTRVEEAQGKAGDDSALNDVKFFCCGLDQHDDPHVL